MDILCGKLYFCRVKDDGDAVLREMYSMIWRIVAFDVEELL